MKFSDIPTKIETAFARDAGVDYRATIPESTADFGRASWVAGFPPATFQPIGAGGTPPWGADMNGVLYASTIWLNWLNAGAPVAYDAAFASEIGGYPSGATLIADNGYGWWFSVADDNAADPDAGGAGWLLVPVERVYAGNPNGRVPGYAPQSNTANALRPPSICWDDTNRVFWRCSTTGNAASAVWQPITNLMPTGATLTGNSKSYTVADNGCVRVRSNSGAAMSDSMPTASGVDDGWHCTFVNADATASLTLNFPSGTSLNGVAGPTTQALTPGQTVGIVSAGSGVYWKFFVPFTPQAAAGSEGEVQYNGSGVLAATPNVKWNAAQNRLELVKLLVTSDATIVGDLAVDDITADQIGATNYQGFWYGYPPAYLNVAGTTSHFWTPPGFTMVIGQGLNISPNDQVTIPLGTTFDQGTFGATFSFVSNTNGLTQNGPSWITANNTSVTFRNNTSGFVDIVFFAAGRRTPS